MEVNDQGILFMGTPEFAVATLDALVSAGLDVRAVVTAPDRPAGRGRQLRASAVKQRALELGLPVLQPEKLKDPTFLQELDRINASLYVVVAFRMLPEVVWARPAFGTINLHASLLPAYRGAAPINWAVANGEKQTGATTFRIQQAIDTGDLLLQEAIAIGPMDSAGDVHDKLMKSGADLMVRTVRGTFEGELVPVPQVLDDAELPTAPKLDNVNTRIHFERPAQTVHDMIRGMSPYPGAWCEWHVEGAKALHCKILASAVSDRQSTGVSGDVSFDGTRMFVACKNGMIEVLELQLEGRKRMSTADLIRGMRSQTSPRLE